MEKNNSQELLIDNNKLKVGFIDADINQKQFISIFDDNITTSMKSNSKSKLKEYSIENNGDGSYELSFNVKNKVDVSFVYNEDLNVYEIQLEDGEGKEKVLSKTFVSEEEKPLRIDFVNHNKNSNAKSSEYTRIRKPIIIID